MAKSSFGKSELATLYNMSWTTLKRRLKREKFDTKGTDKMFTPIDVEAIFQLLGPPNAQ